MKPTHEAQNPMVYGIHRRTPFTNNTISQAYVVLECTATRRGPGQLMRNVKTLVRIGQHHAQLSIGTATSRAAQQVIKDEQRSR
jgi:hypothetical protein